jgi:hypothetical protein
MPTQAHGLSQRIEEDLAVRTCTKVATDFTANVLRQLIVHIRRQMPEYFEAECLGMAVTGSR